MAKRMTTLVGALATLPALAGMCSATAAADDRSQIIYGVFAGNGSVADAASFTGKTPGVKTLFEDFDHTHVAKAEGDLTQAWNEGTVPILTWELGAKGNDPKHTPNSDIDVRIAQGQKDTYIDDYASMIHRYVAGPDGRIGTNDDRKVYLRIAHEMNGNWYPWSSSKAQKPSDYVNAWRHIHEHFDAAGLTSRNVQYMWIPMGCGPSGLCVSHDHPVKDYYPGSQYVDWVGVDAYNWGTTPNKGGWQQPDALLTKPLNEVSAIAPGKPLAIPEIGSADTGGDKKQWFNDLYGFSSYFHTTNGGSIKLMSYFNLDKEAHWAAYGGSGGDTTVDGIHGFSTYRSMVRHQNSIGGGNAHLTNNQFHGQ